MKLWGKEKALQQYHAIKENSFNSRKFSVGDEFYSSGKVENETAFLTL